MRPATLDIRLRNGSHSQLIESPGVKCRKGACERDLPSPYSAAQGYTHQVLFRNETFDVTVWKRITELLGESGIFGVSIKGDNSVAVLAEFYQSGAVCQSGGNLKRKGFMKYILGLTGKRNYWCQ